jgi:hypothetical protein
MLFAVLHYKIANLHLLFAVLHYKIANLHLLFAVFSIFNAQ